MNKHGDLHGIQEGGCGVKFCKGELCNSNSKESQNAKNKNGAFLNSLPSENEEKNDNQNSGTPIWSEEWPGLLNIKSTKVKQATSSRHVSGLNNHGWGKFNNLQQVALVSNNLKELMAELELFDATTAKIKDTPEDYLYFIADTHEPRGNPHYAEKSFKYIAVFYVPEK